MTVMLPLHHPSIPISRQISQRRPQPSQPSCASPQRRVKWSERDKRSPKIKKKRRREHIKRKALPLSRRAQFQLLMTARVFQVCPLRNLSFLARSDTPLCPHQRLLLFPPPTDFLPASAHEQGVRLPYRPRLFITAYSQSALPSAGVWYASAHQAHLALQFRLPHWSPLSL